MLSIGSVPTEVLFDSGYTHSFKLYTHTHTYKNGGQIESLGYSLLASTPADRVIATGECVRDVPAEIQ